MSDLKNLEKKLGFVFKNQALLNEAVTHRSFLNENPEWSFPHNERLEYLGDAVLELVVSDFLFNKYPDVDEGKLTSYRAALVNYQMMARVAKEFGLEDFLLLSKGEAKDNGKAREVILADGSEALIGAIYLDQGYDQAASFITSNVLPHLTRVIEEGLYQDPKSLLQEIIQEDKKITPTYRVIEESGPEHQKNFLVGVYFDEELIAEGPGTSKQEAERQAAEKAIEILGLKNRK
ncbi:MAG: ribonuclease III [bacterium]|nr:ribonuclease III [bacterium]